MGLATGRLPVPGTACCMPYIATARYGACGAWVYRVRVYRTVYKLYSRHFSYDSSSLGPLSPKNTLDLPFPTPIVAATGAHPTHSAVVPPARNLPTKPSVDPRGQGVRWGGVNSRTCSCWATRMPSSDERRYEGKGPRERDLYSLQSSPTASASYEERVVVVTD